MSPVFSTREQEKLFAKCARESMSIDARLRWYTQIHKIEEIEIAGKQLSKVAALVW